METLEENNSLTGEQMVIDLSGPDGNANVVMTSAYHIIRKVLGIDTANVYSRLAKAGNYANVLKVTNDYVCLVDTSNSYPEVLDEYEVVTTIVKKN